MKVKTIKTVSTRELRTRLGGYLKMVNTKEQPLIGIKNSGNAEYTGILCSVQFLKDNGIDIPSAPIEEKEYLKSKEAYEAAKAVMTAYEKENKPKKQKTETVKKAVKKAAKK